MTRPAYAAGTARASGDSRDELARLGHAAVAAGLVVGSGGNLSARVPGTDECWVTASGTWLDQLDRASFTRVLLDGAPLVDQRSGVGAAEYSSAAPTPTNTASAPAPVPTSELALHLAVYRARADVNVVVHLHPQTVLLLDALGETVRLATTDHVYYLRRVDTVPFHPPGSQTLADAVAATAATGVNCLVLARHGCAVLADTVELAHKRVRYLEEAAQLTYRALLLGRVGQLVPPGQPARGDARLDAPTDWL